VNKKEQIKFDAINAIKMAIRYPAKSRLAAETIVADICDRKGLKDAWASINQDIRYEIVDTWTEIIDTIFDSAFDVNDFFKQEVNK
jgi:ppGpp synthetase/RelA/SpoT-type nucleotidyltranferase